MELSDRWLKLDRCLPSKVNLLAVSKGHSEMSIRGLAELGQVDFGESRLQEALPKMKNLQDIQNIRWHFIGRLQSNKVRAVLKHFDVIHSVDSFLLASRISRVAGEEMVCPKVMLQIKFREDSAKAGFSPQEVCRVWPELIELPNIKFQGLMTITPRELPLEDRKNLFRDCRDLANRLGLKDCSMGMSNDWEEAIKAGATWVRLGSILFGERPMNANFSRDITKSK